MDFSSNNIQKIIKNAEYYNDRKTLRLFGFDGKYEEKTNSGGLENQELFWKEWLTDDLDAVNLK